MLFIFWVWEHKEGHDGDPQETQSDFPREQQQGRSQVFRDVKRLSRTSLVRLYDLLDKINSEPTDITFVKLYAANTEENDHLQIKK